MNSARFEAIASRYSGLHVALLGDFCLDRYFEIDPARQEVSIETGLPVHNIARTRCQPGGAGTILNNLVALGAGEIHPVGFCGEDGEGWELRRAMGALAGVKLDRFISTPERKTFTYSKPLVVSPPRPPVELSRLDTKNWTATPVSVERRLQESVREISLRADALIVLDQVELSDTGVVTRGVLAAVGESAAARPDLVAIADSRQGLAGFPPVIFKMNAAELARFSRREEERGPGPRDMEAIRALAADLARRNRRPVFVTLAERGMVGASPGGETAHVPALPVRGEIDIVGAGDAVTANLTMALAAGATLQEALEIASAAASVVIHMLGTTGTASVATIRERLEPLFDG